MTAQPHHVVLARGRELTDQAEKRERNEKEKAKEQSMWRMTGNERLLFSLYGVGWSHVVAGDVTFLSGVNGASLPPVALPEEKNKLEIRTTQHGQKVMNGKKYTYTEKRTASLKVNKDRRGARSFCASFSRLTYPSCQVCGGNILILY